MIGVSLAFSLAGCGWAVMPGSHIDAMLMSFLGALALGVSAWTIEVGRDD